MFNDLSTKLAALFLCFFFLANDIMASASALAHAEFRESSNSAFVPTFEKTPATTPVASPNPTDKTVPYKAPKAEVGAVTFFAKETAAYLGLHEEDPLNMPADDVFNVDITTDPQDYKFAYLKYIAESKDHLSVSDLPVTINDNKTFYKAVGSEKDIVDLPAHLFSKGLNKIRFNNPALNAPVKIENVQLILSNSAIAGTVKYEEITAEKASENHFICMGEHVENKFVENKLTMPSVPSYITNVTAEARGYKVVSKDETPLRISIKYKEGITDASSRSKIKLFYFDKEQNRWDVAEKTVLEGDNHMASGEMPGNTSYFAGMIKTPEMPEASAFAPTAISDIKAANPASGMNIMQAPSISQTGEARISYPLEIPEGRNGMTPNLNLSYSSDAGTGWLGVGWNLSMPQISVDTRWGVPSYDNSIETEVYSINGNTLSMEGNYKANRDRVTRQSSASGVNFIENTRSNFKSLKRYGNSPSTYYWVETMANGTTYYYGGDALSGVDPAYVLKDPGTGNIASWYLKKIEDKWGNFITYTYEKHTIPSSDGTFKKGGEEIFPASITYTGHGSDTPGYQIVFSTGPNRLDATVNLKNGFKVVDQRVLNEIIVNYMAPSATQVKKYVFKYSNDSRYKKTLLTAVEEHTADGGKFYEHKFSYYDPQPVQFSTTPQILRGGNYGSNFIFYAMAPPLGFVLANLNGILSPSALGTTKTNGYNIGGNLGVGATPEFLPAQDKGFTFSGNVGFGQNFTESATDLRDVNGDALPDLIFRKQGRILYYPTVINEGQLGLDKNYREIKFSGDLNRSRTNNTSYGFDFSAPFNLYFYGQKWIASKTETRTFLTDFNADGIVDVVEPNNNRNIVFFGSQDLNGDISFSNNSEYTVNPVKSLGSAITATSGAAAPGAAKDLEAVKVWTAPFSGTVQISGNASQYTGATGTTRVGIQYNGSMLKNFTDLTTGSVTVSETQAVSEGDKILFRTKAGEDGKLDFVNWNPQVTYITNQNNKDDANGYNYASTSYADGFLLSGGGASFPGDQEIKIDWPSLTISSLTDKVDLTITIKAHDVDSQAEVLSETKTVSINPSATSSVSLSNFGFGSGYSLGTMGKVHSSLNADHLVSISFKVSANSNVRWETINWRPRITFKMGDCGEQDKAYYPPVYFDTYNRAVQLMGKYTVPGSYPNQLKLRVSLNLSEGDMSTIHAATDKNPESEFLHFTAKTDEKRIGWMPFSIPGEDNIDAVEVVSEMNFEVSQLYEKQLYIALFCENVSLARFLRDHPGRVNVTLKDSKKLSVSLNNYVSIYAKDRADVNDYLLHWGQFVWSNTNVPSDLIDHTNLSIPNRAVAGENNLSEVTDFENIDFNEITTGLNPADQNFFGLIAKRGPEDVSLMRQYIKAKGSSPYYADLDRWSFYSTHIGVYRGGYNAPGKFGEEEVKPDRISTTIPFGVYSAQGITPYSESLTRAESKGPGISTPSTSVALISSETYNEAQYNTHALQAFMDMNGDQYPDIVNLNESNGHHGLLTDPLGGHPNPGDSGPANRSSLYYDNIGELSVSQTESSGLMANGSYINEDKRFTKNSADGSGSGSGSVSFGEDFGRVEWFDINGDGLPDKIKQPRNEEAEVYLSTGKSLLSAVDMPSQVYGLSASESFGFALGASFGNSNMKQGVGKSFSLGININDARSKKERLFIDMNGDGLADQIIRSSEGDYSFKLNTGSSFIDCNACLSAVASPANLPDAGVNGSYGFSANGAFTVGFPLFAFVKGSAGGGASYNFAMNELKSALIDMDGDGLPDFVERYKDGIKVYKNLVGTTNLLRKVENPLGGSFTIEYEREGNKKGLKTATVKMHDGGNDEPSFWFMPFSKWVMSAVTVHDGYDINGNGLNDGADQQRYEFKYDGGIQSRRNRQFLGFSRTETLMPKYTKNTISDLDPDENGCSYRKNNLIQKYTSKVTEYFRPTDLSFNTLKMAWYLQGVVFNSRTYFNEYEANEYSSDDDQCLPNRYTEVITETRKRMSEVIYDYAFYEMNNSGSHMNEVAHNSNGDLTEITGFSNLSESACVFPAVVSEAYIDVPNLGTPAKIRALKYDLTYDAYLNVTSYTLNGYNGNATKTTQIIASIENVKVETRTLGHSLSDFLEPQGTEFQSYTQVLHPYTGQRGYVIPYPEEGFSKDTLYYNFPSGPCYTGPGPVTTDTICNPDEIPRSDKIVDTYTCEIPGDETAPCTCYIIDAEIFSYHQKETIESIQITREVDNVPYISELTAVMEYFDPAGANANGKTNILKSHKIFSGTLGNINDLLRYSRVHTLTAEGAPAQIWSYIEVNDFDNESVNRKSLTHLAYDTYGNITEIEGSENHAGDAVTVNFSYDTRHHQFIERVENESYDYISCSHYDPKTGNLLSTTDINGNPMVYEYDNYYRMKRVFGPNEILTQTNPAPSLEFEYHPFGDGSAGIPVAYTYHNTGTAASVPGTTGAAGTCGTYTFTAGSMSSSLKTATFIDGTGRVIQVKKEVSVANSTGTANEVKRQLSGFTQYDYIWRPVKVTGPSLEPASATLGNINMAYTDNVTDNAVSTTYDYAFGRVTREYTPRTGSGRSQWDYAYGWDNKMGSEYFYTQKMIVDDNSITAKSRSYSNYMRQQVGTIQFKGSNEIKTTLQPDALGQMLSTTDDLSLTTTYGYDLQGKMLQEVHPDRGQSDYEYDDAGNLIKIVTPATGATGIVMEYDYTRLKKKKMPENISKVNNVIYTYGSFNDGVNGAGRVTQIQQGPNYAFTHFEYDALGHTISEEKILRIPQVGEQTYTTTFSYDGFGKILQMVYPDGDQVDYNYNTLGDLESFSHDAGVLDIISNIVYDGYGNIKTIEYGNGTKTTITTDKTTGRINNVKLWDVNDDYLTNKTFTYNKRELVASVTNTGGVAVGGKNMGGNYQAYYSYDPLNRLSGVSNSQYARFNSGSSITYALNMTYNDVGSILTKAQSYGTSGPNYSLSYSYNGHKVDDITNSSVITDYVYNSSGSVIQHSNGSVTADFCWDEDQKLRGSRMENNAVHYLYDHNGERLMKGSMDYASGGPEGDQSSASFLLAPYMVYVNPYYNVQHFSNIVETSKHFYMGSQRVASSLKNKGFQAGLKYDTDDLYDSWYDIPQSLKQGAERDLQLALHCLGLRDQESMGGGEEAFDFDMDVLLTLPELEGDTLAGTTYWYHSSYLGNTEWVTDLSGKAWQHFYYSPWGETLEHHDAGNGFTSMYRFNAKELDEETGLYYYGARYYNPQKSIWLSVDPWADKYPYITPYNFVENNPLNLVDPDGNGPGNPPVYKNPVTYLYQGLTEWFQGMGTAIDNLGASLSTFFTVSKSVGNNTSIDQTTTATVGTRFKDFFTPTSDNKQASSYPVTFEINQKTEVVNKVKVTGKVDGVDVTYESRSSVNVATGEAQNKQQVTVGAGSNGGFVSHTESSNGSSTTEAGVKVQGTVPVGSSSVTIGGKFSLSKEN
ncbi:RHS repeat-associated protein [Algoriphagus iocasae]|uniref:RHS repeat-associated protein n=1 Tax=Algoriphagus iocasae TaxID=1836499 RepID=A0A841MJN9_9BACT|nr:SpvB/TcaC N-terminal domain-containing protein [Algoriphagus iocasae]MBB6324466.1 RHS repeat-associated protein [Algoriphagus iocasae]